MAAAAVTSLLKDSANTRGYWARGQSAEQLVRRRAWLVQDGGRRGRVQDSVAGRPWRGEDHLVPACEAGRVCGHGEPGHEHGGGSPGAQSHGGRQGSQGESSLASAALAPAHTLSQAYLHDTGGGERFRTLTANFYRHADAAILMYSVEDRYTFENLQEWVESASDVVDSDSFVFALVGNKSDLPLEVEHESIRARCETLSTQLSFFTSAKTGDNVLEAFEKIVLHVHRTRSRRACAPASTGTIIRPSGPKPAKQSCCSTM